MALGFFQPPLVDLPLSRWERWFRNVETFGLSCQFDENSGTEHLFDVLGISLGKVLVLAQTTLTTWRFLRQNVAAVGASVLDFSTLCQLEALGRAAVCFLLWHGLSLLVKRCSHHGE